MTIYDYAVLGAGFQGAAIAYDLSVHGEARRVRLADSDGRRLREATRRLRRLTGRDIFSPTLLDAGRSGDVRRFIRGADAVVSALPYFLNLRMARIAISSGAHFSDLGGNTGIVLKELALHREARQRGVALSPDCGLAPGLSNLLAARAIERLGRARDLRARCGGIPQRPRPPFGYKMVFSLHGLINEYSGRAAVLRNGRITHVDALSEPETLSVPGVGLLEAAVTTGGTSTAPWSFRGKALNFDYKTLRYPGHFDQFRAFQRLGLFSEDPEDLREGRLTPRQVLLRLLEPRIRFEKDRDLIVLVVDAFGLRRRGPRRYRALLVDRGDRRTGFSAMERTTGFPAAAIAHLQVLGKIAPGAIPIERSVPVGELLRMLKVRGLKITERIQ